MVAEVLCGMVQGIQGEMIAVQTDISDGLPIFNMIGYLSAEVKEAKERVRTALKNTGFRIPPKRISVNLAPADVRKSGTYYDLAIAVGLFAAMGMVCSDKIKRTIFLGELALDGTLSPLTGVLPILKAASEQGCARCIIPLDNVEEASVLPSIEVIGFYDLKGVFAYLTGGNADADYEIIENTDKKRKYNKPEEDTYVTVPDISQVKGQAMAKRALEIAVAGYHNLFLDGPPGAGKSMLASCVPGIMPKMTREEMMDTTIIYSVKGMLKKGFSLIEDRPFRAPSHLITAAGMFGGGYYPKPGEISLAHQGVLFLDEFPEFKRDLIELFRVPLEEHRITQVRNGKNITFPADFILIAAANPCPCGYYPDRRYCRCSIKKVSDYQSRLSGPVLDRLDLFVRCDKIPFRVLTEESGEETSSEVRKRINKVWDMQKERFKDSSIRFNGRMTQKEMDCFCVLDRKSKLFMEMIFEEFRLTARSYYRILKIGRTIADLDGSVYIRKKHLQEALLFRRTIPGSR